MLQRLNNLISYPGSKPDTKIGRPKARPYSTYNLLLPNTTRRALEKIAAEDGQRLC